MIMEALGGVLEKLTAYMEAAQAAAAAPADQQLKAAEEAALQAFKEEMETMAQAAVVIIEQMGGELGTKLQQALQGLAPKA